MMHQRRFTKEFEVEAVRQVQTAGEASVRSSHIGRTTARGASRPLPNLPIKARLLNRLPTLDLGGGDYSFCPIAARSVLRESGAEWQPAARPPFPV